MNLRKQLLNIKLFLIFYLVTAACLKPVIFVKTHKTGSSTITEILHHLVDVFDDVNTFVPCGNAGKTWKLFQEEDRNAILHDVGDKKIQIWANHLIWDDVARESLPRLFEKTPTVVTILREPLAQLQSALAYFHTNKTVEELARVGLKRNKSLSALRPAGALGQFQHFRPRSSLHLSNPPVLPLILEDWDISMTCLAHALQINCSLVNVDAMKVSNSHACNLSKVEKEWYEVQFRQDILQYDTARRDLMNYFFSIPISERRQCQLDFAHSEKIHTADNFQWVNRHCKM